MRGVVARQPVSRHGGTSRTRDGFGSQSSGFRVEGFMLWARAMMVMTFRISEFMIRVEGASACLDRASGKRVEG